MKAYKSVGGSNNLSAIAEAPSAAATPLYMPEDVIASNIPGGGSTNIVVSWQLSDRSLNHTGFTINRYPAGVTPSAINLIDSTPVNSASDRSKTFSGMSGLYQFAVITKGAGSNTSPSTLPVENRTEPAAAWTLAYAFDNQDLEWDWDLINESFSSGVSAQWSGLHYSEMDGWEMAPYFTTAPSTPVTLNLAGLPRHSYVRVGINLMNEHEWSTTTSFTAKVDGKDLYTEAHPGYSATLPGYWTVWAGWMNYSEIGEDAFKHDSSTMEIEFKLETVEGVSWLPRSVTVETYFPFVSIGGGGTVIEDGLDPDKHFTVSRPDPNSNTIRGTPLTVKLKAPAGTATNGVDYSNIPSQATIEADDLSKEIALHPIDDDLIEAAEETVLLEIAPNRAIYAMQNAGPTTGVVADEDYEITGADMNFLNANRARNDTGTQELLPRPQWVDWDNDELDDREHSSKYGSNGEVGMPLVYRRSMPGDTRFAAAIARFYVIGNPRTITSVVADGSGPGGGYSSDTNPVVGTLADGTLFIRANYNSNPNAPLPDTIDSDDLVLQWSIKKRTGSDEVYGTTKNHVYVTGAEPLDNYESVYEVACNPAVIGKRPGNPGEAAASALANERAVIDGVWSEFADNIVFSVDNSVRFKYDHSADAGVTLSEMLGATLGSEHGNGECTAWTEFFIMALRPHGITAVDTRIAGSFEINRFRVKLMPAQGSHDSNYGRTDFAYHQVVRGLAAYPNRIYDPSYGQYVESADAASAEVDWEDQNVTHVEVGWGAIWVWEENPTGQDLWFDPPLP